MKQRSNLQVLTDVHVTHALTTPGAAGLRATGVEIRCKAAPCRELQARREVLLCAGALQSPQLLMLSGIGDGAQLQQHGIAVAHHLPGVGQHLHDHPDVVQVVDAPHLKDFFGLSLSGAWQVLKGIFEWRRSRGGMLTTNFAEAGGFMRSSPGRVHGPTCSCISSSASWSTTAARRCSATAIPATSACCSPRAAARCSWPAPTRWPHRASTPPS